ncbi:unnamed protein product [Closterium sp. NIES-53]
MYSHSTNSRESSPSPGIMVGKGMGRKETGGGQGEGRGNGLYLNNGWYYGPLPDLSALKQLTLIDLSGNYLSGPIPAFLQRVKKVNAADNYFSGSASSLPCSDDFSITGNCLSSVPSKCGGTAGQKSTKECNKFCGTATATGACSGKGVCVLDVDKLLNTQASVPMCKCQSGYWASHQKLRCSKNT